MRQSWTDDRLDDLSHRMDERFDQVEGEMKELRAEVKDQGKELRGEIRGIEARLHTQSSEHYVKTEKEFDRVGNDFERVHEGLRQLNIATLDLHRTMTRMAWSAAITVLAGVIGLLLANL